jgi:cyclopropane fatty-acyl-phospholipid synthase-like methyltransferase
MAVAAVRAGRETVIDLRPGSKDASSSQIIYVPTPQKVVEKMLEMARVTRNDVVFDLGCGDGRLLVTAARKYGARGVGIDIDPQRVKEARANVRKAKVEKLVEIRQGDALKVPDLARATVVVTYMLPEFMEKLKPILEEHLKPGTRVVAHDYPIHGWEAEERVTVPSPSRIYAHTLYRWTVPQKKD